MLLLLVLSGVLGLFPAGGGYESTAGHGHCPFVDVLNHLFLPVMTLTPASAHAIIMPVVDDRRDDEDSSPSAGSRRAQHRSADSSLRTDLLS